MPRHWETTRLFFLSAPRSAFVASRWCSLPAGCFPKLLQRLPPGHSVQGLPRSGNSPAQTSASLHPPAALRLRVLPFTRTWSSTVCAEEFPTPLERSICQIVSVHWIAAAQTDANLSAHLHRLPTPPPYLRRMRLSPGGGADIGCWMRLALCQ